MEYMDNIFSSMSWLMLVWFFSAPAAQTRLSDPEARIFLHRRSDGSSGSLYAGKRENYGISRILMKFPGMNLSSIFNSDQIIKATVELRDLMCESIEIPLYCYVYTGGYWTESTASWSNVNPNGYSTYLDHNTISYANGEKISHRYQFDITNAVKSWKAGSISNNGIIFKTTASVENGDVYTTKTFASFNRASYKPTCTVVYSNPFYSLYSTTYQKYSNASLTADDNLQYRANCYGYALRMFCAVSGNYTYYNAYKQQPDEFVFKGNGGLNLYRHGQYSFTITDWEDLVMVYNEIFSAENSAASIKLNFVYDLMVADMNELGYTITQTTASSLENDPNTSTRRLCALVVGDYDYHFYIQHSDGVWSHKPGQSVPSNKCLDCQLPLTNANFAEHALEGGYTKGIRYFYVTKSAVIDYGNLNGHYDSCKGTSVYSPDGAGNTFIPAKVLPPSVTLAGRIDYKGDADFYAINIASPGTRTITVTTTSVDTTPDPYPISISVYLPTAMFVKSASSTTGTATLTNQFSKGIYYIQITSSGQSAYEYGRRYNIRFE